MEILKERRERSPWIDWMRFIGIFLIAYGHSVQGGIVRHYMYSFHVPLFFFLQGITFNLADIKRRPFAGYVKSRAISLLVPYFIFGVISTIIFLFLSKFIAFPTEMTGSFSENIVDLINGYCIANRPLWFLPCAFLVSIFGYAIIRLSERSEKRTVSNIILLLFAILGIIYAYLNSKYRFAGKEFWKSDIILSIIVFFVAGYLFQEYKMYAKVMKMPKIITVLLAVLLMTAGFVIALYNGEIKYYSGIFYNVFEFYSSAFLSVLGVCFICILLPEIKCFTAIGRITVSVLVMHKFPILFFQYVIPYTSAGLQQNSFIMGFTVTAISIALCYVAHIIIKKICPIVLGIQQKKSGLYRDKNKAVTS